MAQKKDPQGYLHQSASPLTSLVFILPMLTAYEAGIFLGPQAVQNGAAVWLQNALSTMGLGPYLLLPLATCGVLLGWHYLAKQPWTFCWWTPTLMLFESAAWALLLVALLSGYRAVAGALGGSAAADVSETTAAVLGYFGAGIYEELLFRLILLSTIVLVIQSAGAPRRASLVTAILVSSVIFAAAHYKLFTGGGRSEITVVTFGFLTLCGAYFGTLFSFRGFGITAGVHALYDIAVTFLLPH